MDYIQSRAVDVTDAQEEIDKAKEEHGEPSIIHHYQDDSKEVESGDSVQDLTDMAHDAPVQDVTTKSGTEASYTRQLTFKHTDQGVTLDIPEQFEGASAVKERIKEVQMVNEELERQGRKRRYEINESDIPTGAYVHKDRFGTYYYKGLSISLRPSDVAEYANVAHHGALSNTQKAANAVELLNEMYRPVLEDANTQKAAESWLNRHMVLTDEDPGSSNTFSHEFMKEVASAISSANGTTNKDRVYVDDPSEVPADANVQEGGRGGYYYETEDLEGGGGNLDENESVESYPADAGSDKEYDDMSGVDTNLDEIGASPSLSLAYARDEEYRRTPDDLVEDVINGASLEEVKRDQVDEFIESAPGDDISPDEAATFMEEQDMFTGIEYDFQEAIDTVRDNTDIGVDIPDNPSNSDIEDSAGTLADEINNRIDYDRSEDGAFFQQEEMLDEIRDSIRVVASENGLDEEQTRVLMTEAMGQLGDNYTEMV